MNFEVSCQHFDTNQWTAWMMGKHKAWAAFCFPFSEKRISQRKIAARR